jgi:hypothetical protein
MICTFWNPPPREKRDLVCAATLRTMALARTRTRKLTGEAAARVRLWETNVRADARLVKYTLCLSFLGLTALPPLPSVILSLTCDGNAFATLTRLPSTLTYLSCEGAPLVDRTRNLDNWCCVYAGRSRLRRIGTLPHALTVLACARNPHLDTLPPLPYTLRGLFCDAHLRLPDACPPGLETLSVSRRHVPHAQAHWRRSVAQVHAWDRAACLVALPIAAALYV